MPVVFFEIPLDGIPHEVVDDARNQLHDVATSLSHVHPNSPLWESIRESGLRLGIEDWLFTYLVDDQAAVVRVVAAARR